MTPEQLQRLEELEKKVKNDLEYWVNRINPIEKALETLLKTIKFWEKKLGKNVMPKGTYCGVEF